MFGGTFDPPHIGHLVAALDAQAALDLDIVLLVVANVPWQKVDSREISSAEDRVAMVRAAVADAPFLEVSELELERGGASYTVDTLADLEREHPGAELFVILGDDAAAGFGTWERYEEVARAATLVVVDRPGHPSPVDERFSWTRVDIPELEISSTEIRDRVRSGRSIRYLTPDGVASVIEARSLYR